MDDYSGCCSYVTIASVCKVDLDLSKHRKILEEENVRQKIVDIKNERFLYLSSTTATKRHWFVSAVNYKRNRDLLKQFAAHEIVMKKEEEFLKQNRIEDVQLPASFRDLKL